MKYQHYNLSYEIDDEWLAEAGALGFVASRESFRTSPVHEDLLLVALKAVEPLIIRATSIGIFCDDPETGATARERTVRILRWFVTDAEVEPIKVVPMEGCVYKYRVVAGCHRFYCAHAMGFKRIPAVRGFEIAADNT